MICKLALEDGSIFTGVSIGAAGTRTGEVVFNTAMTGYQEVFTDPSYCGQIVTMTFTQQGNYGVNPEDFESKELYLSGVVVHELPRRPSNFRSTLALAEFLQQNNIVAIAGIDTRALTRRLRVQGALRGVLSTEITDDVQLVKLAREAAPMTGSNLVAEVSPHENAAWTEPLWHLAAQRDPGSAKVKAGPNRKPRVVALDCGIKHNILRHLVNAGCEVVAAPSSATAAQVRALRPDGLLAGNGPGDPAAVQDTIEMLRSLLGELPIFGICLGHQLLGLALGAKTYKLRFGHHGANMPVINKLTGKVEITSQNHGFAVEVVSLEKAGGTPTHINLNDESLEGFIHRDLGLMAVQFHPEASPGPHDAGYLFRQFAELIRTRKPVGAVAAAAD